jgi:hypothetical protein
MSKHSVFFLLSDLVCSQIWLNYFVNDDHFDYVTKSLKKTLVQHVKNVQHSQKAMLEDMGNKPCEQVLRFTGSMDTDLDSCNATCIK